MEDKRPQILELIRAKGPVLPIQVAKATETNTLLASAMLSELLSQKKILISTAKIGSSPVYYLPGQEIKLQNLYNNLSEKEKKTYDFLKQKKILRDKNLEPVLRVALRQIKDFAKPFIIEINGQKETFWRWYLFPAQEAEKIVKEKLLKPKIEPKKVEPIKQEKLIKKEVKQKPRQPTGEFLNKINNFFSHNKIDIIEKNIIRNNKDVEFLVKVPSAVGSIQYYCKAKNKKRISDSDLSSVLVQAQLKKIPALLLSTGELSKKASEMINNKELKGIIFRKI